MKVHVFLGLALTLSLPLMAQAGQQQGKAAAETAIAKIHDTYRYNITTLSVSGAVPQDIEMACMGEVFLQWFGQMTGVIDRTDGLTFGEVNGFHEAEQKSYLVQNDRKIYEHLRPDVTARILSEIEKRRAESKWPQGPNALTLQDYKEQDMLANYKQCRDEEFVTAVRNSYDAMPDSGEREITIEVSGYQPRFKAGEKPYKIPPYYNNVDGKGAAYTASYENWLYDILTR